MNEDMQALSREMTKAGLIEEMMAEGMDEALGGGDEVEEEAGLEINAILAELVPDLPDAPWNAVKPVSRGSRVKEHGRRHVSIDPGGRVSLSLSLSPLRAQTAVAAAPVAASAAAAEVDEDDVAIAALQARAEAL